MEQTRMIQPVLCRKKARRKIRQIVKYADGGSVLKTVAIDIYVNYTCFLSKSRQKTLLEQ